MYRSGSGNLLRFLTEYRTIFLQKVVFRCIGNGRLRKETTWRKRKEQMPLCAAVSDLDNYDHRQYALDPGALDFESGWSYWVEFQDMWGYCVPFDATDIIHQYNRDTGRNNLLVWGGHITLYYQNGAWTYIEDDALSEGQIAAAPAPTAEELKEMGLRVYVCCAESKHDTKSDFPLPTDGQLTFTPVWNKVEQRSEYCVSLTAAAADSYVAQYLSLIHI